MTLRLVGSTNPYERFNIVLNNAHRRYFAKATAKHAEPRFVRALIADRTIRSLNSAASGVYHPGYGMVYFRGGYLHHNPYAKFTALWPGNQQHCRRELADALLVVYETAPSVHGSAHSITRRRACLLMFKPEQVAAVSTPAFVPGTTALPPGGHSTHEQFYLFNQWPAFDLETGRKTASPPVGNYKVSGPGQHDIGKYAVVWGDSKASPWKSESVPARETRWLYANPVPGCLIAPSAQPPQSGSLGYMLQEMIAGSTGYGRSFDPEPPKPVGLHANGWDELLGNLLGSPSMAAIPPVFVPGRLAAGSYYNESREVNPAGMQFLAHGFGALDDGFIGFASEYQHWAARVGRLGELNDTARETARLNLSYYLHHHPWLDSSDWPDGNDRLPGGPSDGDMEDGDRLPVLIAVVHRWQPWSDALPRTPSVG